MKNIKCSLMIFAVVVFASFAHGGTNEVSALLQKGLFEEEANRNLEAAIQAYQAVVTQTDKDRKFAATAIFRLGECYRKQGKTNEATAQYERIVRDFADQSELVKLSREYVGSPVTTPGLTYQGRKDTNQALTVESSLPTTSDESREMERLEKMIKESPDLINAPLDGRPGGENPLIKAVKRGQMGVTKFLLDKKAVVDPRDATTGGTPLLFAAEHGNKEMFQLLLDYGADINTATQLSGPFGGSRTEFAGFTALHFAAARGYKAIADILLARKVNVNAKSNSGKTPLYLAAEKGFKSVAELLISKGAEVNLADQSGVTPLHAAVQAGNKTITELLLANKADVDSKTVDGSTPLHAAASDRNLEIIKILLANKADINAKTKAGLTPLLTAVSQGSKQAVELLLSEGADINAQTSERQTALYWSVGNRWTEKTEIILKYKPELELPDKDGFTPLQRAIGNGDAATLEMLLNAGANINTPYQNYGGASPLQTAIMQKNKPIVLILLAHKPNVDLQDKYGNTAISTAKSLAKSPQNESMNEIVELLRKAGANENLQRNSTISVSRKSNQISNTIFFKGTNSANRYTLFELIAIGCVASETQFPFPDFTRVKLNRLNGKTGANEEITIDLDALFKSGDCSKDMWLQWGDEVEIPELDHKINEKWVGFPRSIPEFLVKCLKREVSIRVKGETTTITLEPGIQSTLGGPPRIEPSPGNRALEYLLVKPFMTLNQAIARSGLLRASSDITKVKVIRIDPETKKNQQMVINAEMDNPKTDLWLRDGDVIEIPEKQ